MRETTPTSPTFVGIDVAKHRLDVFTQIPQMDWRSASLVHQFRLVGQDLTLDQVTEA